MLYNVSCIIQCIIYYTMCYILNNVSYIIHVIINAYWMIFTSYLPSIYLLFISFIIKLIFLRRPDKLTILKMAVRHLKALRYANGGGHKNQLRPTFLTVRVFCFLYVCFTYCTCVLLSVRVFIFCTCVSI